VAGRWFSSANAGLAWAPIVEGSSLASPLTDQPTLTISRYENDNRRLLRARALIDSEYWSALDIDRFASVALVSSCHV